MEEIVCPKCHSNQISAGQKGFNSTAAVVSNLAGNSILTSAGIGMLGSNKSIITCLKCGNKFQPGDGTVKSVTESGEQSFEKQIFVDKDKIAGRRIALVLTIVLIIIVIALFSFFNSLKSHNDVSNATTVTTNASITSANGANVRQAPSVTSSVVIKLTNNDRVLIIDKTSNPDNVHGNNGYWYKIKTENGMEGFMWSATVRQDE